uniref:Uncharacterized protein n=1 Tax=Acrobeloides nanus TaxID=290746 RepID=A0A914C211_9BILA
MGVTDRGRCPFAALRFDSFGIRSYGAFLASSRIRPPFFDRNKPPATRKFDKIQPPREEKSYGHNDEKNEEEKDNDLYHEWPSSMVLYELNEEENWTVLLVLKKRMSEEVD